VTDKKPPSPKRHAKECSLLTSYDIYLFRQGKHFRLYEKLGSHLMDVTGSRGVYFAVWAPNAKQVSVIGDFNSWDSASNPLKLHDNSSGIWEGFIPNVNEGALYKYSIVPKQSDHRIEKADPFAFLSELPPRTASVVWDASYEWGDSDWMAGRMKSNSLAAPISAYEVHLGSWKKGTDGKSRWMTYRELADALSEYVCDMGYTHVELMPVMEHPFYGSWGYQTTGYFAPTSRFGSPADFKYFIEELHKDGIGVILDWVPSHFPTDPHGLASFDGTCLYEYADKRKGFHPDWKSNIFDYKKHEVRSFLISNALFWLDRYHADGLRVDAVASMLYLDYSRKNGEWLPNEYGGKENLEAISFLRLLNEVVYGSYPDVQMIAEESTAWPMVSRPIYLGGLGFGMKWNMGWMHDTLDYMSKDPIYRKYHHDQLTFSIWYAFAENFMLPLSHDEVVYGKGSMLKKMQGDRWQQFANLRLLYGYMYGHPGKKMLFMGNDFGQTEEWSHEKVLEWGLICQPLHKGLQRWMRDLNMAYKREHALYDLDFSTRGFEWANAKDWENSIISFIRSSTDGSEKILTVCNFTPIPRTGYLIGVPSGGIWSEILNSDIPEYGGGGHGNFGKVEARPIKSHGKPFSLSLTLPPLAALFLKNVGNKE